MKVLILGKNGQLGYALRQTAPNSVEAIFIGRAECDLSDLYSTSKAILKYSPDVVINAASYTAVDSAEFDRDLAFRVNAESVQTLAQACVQQNARLIQVSTDFVFSGKACRPYTVDSQTDPLSIYGASKLAGEEAVISTLGLNWVLVRTAWLYSEHGSNFVKTMLRLMLEKDSLGVVSDQVGTPTWATELARAIWIIVDMPKIGGIHHWTDAGVASWYDFAIAIQDEALELGILPKKISVKPIRTEDYRTSAIRPAYSVLDKTVTWRALGLQSTHWRENLKHMLKEIVNA